MNEVDRVCQLGFDLAGAKRCAQQGRIDDWVHHYLLSGVGGPTNPQFSDGLKLARRWWNGLLEVALTDLSPAVGTDPGMEYVVDKDEWKQRTGKMADTFTTLSVLPPLIVEYRAGELSVRDGNTRLGAMELLGCSTCWVVIWYNSEQDYLDHTARLSS